MNTQDTVHRKSAAELPLVERDDLNARRIRFAHLQRKDSFLF